MGAPPPRRDGANKPGPLSPRPKLLRSACADLCRDIDINVLASRASACASNDLDNLLSRELLQLVVAVLLDE